MAVVSDIEIRLRADIARLQQDMTAARRAVDGGLSSITKAASMATKALGLIGVGFTLKEFISSVIDAQREFDKLNASLVTATGSTANAAQAFIALQKFASTTPYSVAEATEAFIKLRNLGLSPSEKALTSYGNTAAAMGKGLNQLIEAVADAATGEFERLKEFGIKAKQNGDLVALTFQGTTKIVGNNAKDIQKYLQDIGNNNFAGAMEKRLNTLDGAISNLSDTWSAFLRTVANSGVGSAAQTGVMQLSAAINDLGAIMEIVGGKADAEGKVIGDVGALHSALTTVFEALSVAGINIAYVFEEIGKEIGSAGAALFALAKGDFKGALKIAEERQKQEDIERKAIDAKSAAILNASKVRQAAQTAEASNTKTTTQDQLAQYEIVLTAEQRRDKALNDSLDLRNRLNGVNAQTAGDLKKLKEALDTGAISQAQYNKFISQVNKETTLASTAYKEGAKAIDISTEAIKRRAQVQEYANKLELQRLDFLHRTGQMDDADFIAKQADVDVAALQAQKVALEQQMALLKGRYDTEKDRAALQTQMDGKDQEISARRIKQGQDQFELEQKIYREAVGNTADLIEAAQAEAQAQKGRTRDQQDEIELLGLTEKQIAEVTAARIRDQAAALDRRAEIGIIEDVNDALRAQADELRKQADLGLTKQRVTEQKKFWSDVEQTAHDTFISIADGGKGAFQRLKDTAKNIFFEWLYQMTLKKWVINIGASVSGAGAVAGLASNGGTLMQAGGVLSSVSNLYSAITGGATLAGGVGSGFLGSLVGGLNGAGSGAPLASSLGLSIGTKIAETLGPKLAGALSTGITGLAKALPWVGGAVAVYSLAKAAFGMGPKQYADNSTLTGTLGSGGFNGTLNTAWSQKGGWFRSNKSGTDRAAVDAVTASGLGAAYAAIKDASTDYAKVLGLNADSIANRTQALSITMGKDQAANQKAIEDFFSGVADSIANELMPSLYKYQKQGETSSVTLQRLVVDFATVDAIMGTLGVDSQTAFRAVGAAAIEAKERLIDLAGGLDNLTSQTSYFYENFLTKAEQLAPAQKEVTEQLAKLGYAGVTTAGQFKDVVMGVLNSGSVAFESGAKTYETLLALAPKFKAVNDYLVEIAKNGVDVAMGALGRAVNAQKDIVTKAYNDSMKLLQTRIDGVSDSISRMTDLSQALKGALVGVDAPGSGEASRAAADAQIATALAIAKASGVLPSADDLRGALSTLTADSSNQFSSLADYQRAVARSNAQLSQLGDLTDSQLGTAELQLKTLQDLQTQSEAAYNAELSRLDAMVTQAQAQLDAVNGVNTSVLSVNDAMVWVYQAIRDLQGVQGVIPTVNAPTIPVVSQPQQSGTMQQPTEETNVRLSRLEQLFQSMVESNSQIAKATTQFSQDFSNVSGGGNTLLVEQTQR